MVVEIKYMALQWDNHQGGSGRPFEGRLLRRMDADSTLIQLQEFAIEELNKEQKYNVQVIGDYKLVEIVVADPEAA